MRALLAVLAVLAVSSGDVKAQAVGPRFALNPTVGLLLGAPRGFGNECDRASVRGRMAGTLRLSDRIAVTTGLALQSPFGAECVILVSDSPPSPNGFHDVRINDPAVGGLKFSTFDAQLSFRPRTRLAGTRLEASAGISWIPSKDLVGPLASVTMILPTPGKATAVMVGLDVDWIRVPYRIRRTEHRNGMQVGQALLDAKETVAPLTLWMGVALTSSPEQTGDPSEATRAALLAQGASPSLARHLLVGAGLGLAAGFAVGWAFDSPQDSVASADSFWNYESAYYYQINGSIVGALVGSGAGAVVYALRH